MKKKFIFCLIFFFITTEVFSQHIQSMEFHNQEITDILLVLAESSGTSIIPDETVSGKASFYFSNSLLEDSLDVFLSTYNLFYEYDGKIIRVSKIRSSYDAILQTASIKVDSVSIELIIKSLSKKIGKTILYDTLPTALITLDINNLPVNEILSICLKKYPDYEIEVEESYFYIKRNKNSEQKKSSRSNEYLKKNGDLYTLNLEKGRCFDLLIKLFELEQREYSLFIQSDIQLENLYFAEKDFNTILKLVLEHANADFIIKDNIYYIIDLPKKGISGKIKGTEIISLTWLQASDIPTLLPSEISNNSNLKIDKRTNSVLLTGTQEEILPIRTFIEKIDVQSSTLKYKRIDIKYLEAQDLISLIPQNLIPIQPIVIPNMNSILVTGTNENIKNLESFIEKIDNKTAGVPIRLKYIQSDTLLKNLPPSLVKDTLVDSGYPNLLFYTGSEENLKLFQHELSLIDKPQPQIKYQLLVIQYTKGKNQSLKPTYSVKKATDNSISDFIFAGDLSNIMALSFDVISLFGYDFAAKLNSQIGENVANVFTDTTLTGISGEDIKFQNTDTYRYIEYNYDSSNGTTTKSGTTQQITSGLIVDLNGWVSGDNMITMTVNATISKQNSDSYSSSSTSLTTLPSTSERVVTTQVRAMSGEPIVISGLIKEDETETINRTPLLGYIPFLGKLFSQTTKSKEKTEIMIYIVPHLIQEYSRVDADVLNIERYYNEFVGK